MEYWTQEENVVTVLFTVLTLTLLDINRGLPLTLLLFSPSTVRSNRLNQTAARSSQRRMEAGPRSSEGSQPLGTASGSVRQTTRDRHPHQEGPGGERES